MDLDEIQQLIIEEIAGTITPERRQLLHDILAENPVAFERWRDMHEVLPPQKVEEIEAGLQMERPQEIIDAQKRRERKIYFARAVSFAAAVIAIACTSWYYFIYTRQQQENTTLLAGNNKQIQLQLPGGQTVNLSDTSGQQMQVGQFSLQNNHKKLHYTSTAVTPHLITLNIPAGKDYTIVLSDGTEVMMNAASTLQFPSAFTGNTREVTIRGEAFLKVAQQAGKSFVVHLPGNTVQVLGTSFNVNTYDSSRVKIALVSGKVKVRGAKDSVVLKPGFEAASGVRGVQIAPFDADEVLSWQKGIYEFYNVPFSAAAGVISRWYGIELVIDDPAINNRPFTGTIDRNKPVKTFLDNMRATNGLSYYLQGETIHVK